jgi:hypothetical protein
MKPPPSPWRLIDQQARETADLEKELDRLGWELLPTDGVTLKARRKRRQRTDRPRAQLELDAMPEPSRVRQRTEAVVLEGRTTDELRARVRAHEEDAHV